MLYFLLVRRTPASIGDISTTFMGVFYGAYLPSFWVRLRALGTGNPMLFWAGVRGVFPWYPSWAPLPVPDSLTQVRGPRFGGGLLGISVKYYWHTTGIGDG